MVALLHSDRSKATMLDSRADPVGPAQPTCSRRNATVRLHASCPCSAS
jgi:hypothetical protein